MLEYIIGIIVLTGVLVSATLLIPISTIEEEYRNRQDKVMMTTLGGLW